MSAPSATVATSLTKRDVAPLLLMGMSSKCCTLASRELIEVTYMVLPTRRLPDGVTALFFVIASTTWSADKLYIRSFAGSTLIRTDRALDPNGGGADKPGTVANSGRIRVMARSKISFSDLVGLLNTSSPTGREEASKRITCGGSAPGGKKAIVRLTCKAI